MGITKPILKRKMKLCSQGTRKKIALVIATVDNEARLALLDEPTTGVDVESRKKAWKLLRHPERTDPYLPARVHPLSVLLSTHMLEEAAAQTSKLIILSGGEVRAVIHGRYNEGMSNKYVVQASFTYLTEEDVELKLNSIRDIFPGRVRFVKVRKGKRLGHMEIYVDTVETASRFVDQYLDVYTSLQTLEWIKAYTVTQMSLEHMYRTLNVEDIGG
eukprot:GHVO01015711.1.p1 GENE.GHVO01015711.1~~GHVO01015711.1.p1  ORF type:complete len:233 (+),score=29.19 GHVO01015711.1:54-701(+)